MAASPILPEDIVVLVLSFVSDIKTLELCATLCKSWLAIYKNSLKLQQHLFSIFWPHQNRVDKTSIFWPNGASIYERHLIMKHNFQRILQSTHAYEEWATPALAGQDQHSEISLVGAIYNNTLPNIDTYFLSVRRPFHKPQTEENFEASTAFQLLLSDSKNPEALISMKDIIKDTLPGLKPDLDVVLGRPPKPISQDEKSSLVRADVRAISSQNSDFICWKYGESIYLLDIQRLSVKTFPFDSTDFDSTDFFGPDTRHFAHNRGIYCMSRGKLCCIDFGAECRRRWTTMLRFQTMEIISSRNGFIALSNFVGRVQEQDLYFCLVDASNGRICGEVNLGEPRPFPYDSSISLHYHSSNTAILVTTDRIFLLRISLDAAEERSIVVVDQFSNPDHVFRAQTYAFNLLLVDMSPYTGYVVPDYSKIQVFRISETKIELIENAAFSVQTPFSMSLDQDLNLFTTTTFSPNRFVKYRLGPAVPASD